MKFPALSIYRPGFARTVIYMLQSTEYQAGPYLRWFWRTNDFGKVMHRRSLIRTRPARLLLTALRAGMLVQAALGIYLLLAAAHNQADLGMVLAMLFILSTPIVWGHLIVLPLVLGRLLIIKPYYGHQVRSSKSKFKAHRAVKIAVAGSYGKTTMKEILLTVLSQGKKAAATPANRNVSISHAQFAARLEGDEEILIIEYGEGAPGDVKRFAKITRPDIGIITGLAPAHLDKYKTLQRAGEDIFSLADYLEGKNVYVNGESNELRPFIKKSYATYDSHQVLGWRIGNIRLGFTGLAFEMSKDGKTMRLKSRLLGRHLVGTLALAAALAQRLGLTPGQVEKGVAAVMPFEHRMQPYQLSGAWVIDDTYNGNLEGVKAGLKLLEELPAKRKIYITPGLVDQGAESAKIHRLLGQYIAAARPDIVILMKHSVTDDIIAGIGRDFKGQLVIEDDPLNFYTNLDKFVATGDVVLMQNDWPDQYS